MNLQRIPTGKIWTHKTILDNADGLFTDAVNSFQDFFLCGLPKNHLIVGVKINLINEFGTTGSQNVRCIVADKPTLDAESNSITQNPVPGTIVGRWEASLPIWNGTSTAPAPLTLTALTGGVGTLQLARGKIYWVVVDTKFPQHSQANTSSTGTTYLNGQALQYELAGTQNSVFFSIGGSAGYSPVAHIPASTILIRMPYDNNQYRYPNNSVATEITSAYATSHSIPFQTHLTNGTWDNTLYLYEGIGIFTHSSQDYAVRLNNVAATQDTLVIPGFYAGDNPQLMTQFAEYPLFQLNGSNGRSVVNFDGTAAQVSTNLVSGASRYIGFPTVGATTDGGIVFDNLVLALYQYSDLQDTFPIYLMESAVPAESFSWSPNNVYGFHLLTPTVIGNPYSYPYFSISAPGDFAGNKTSAQGNTSPCTPNTFAAQDVYARLLIEPATSEVTLPVNSITQGIVEITIQYCSM